METETINENKIFRSLAEVRQSIDSIDKEIVILLWRRLLCVKAAALFKTTEDSVRDPDRVRKVISQRIDWAKEYGLDEKFIENVFQMFITYFVNTELAKWKAEEKSGSSE